jgi:glutathione S-transferase
MPREINILSPRSQEYFRRTREEALGHRLEDLLADEEKSWQAVSEGMKEVGELIRTNAAEGPFILGAKPSYTDFFLAGSLQTARMVDEGVFERHMEYPGYKDVYEACLPYMEKRD